MMMKLTLILFSNDFAKEYYRFLFAALLFNLKQDFKKRRGIRM